MIQSWTVGNDGFLITNKLNAINHLIISSHSTETNCINLARLYTVYMLMFKKCKDTVNTVNLTSFSLLLERCGNTILDFFILLFEQIYNHTFIFNKLIDQFNLVNSVHF